MRMCARESLIKGEFPMSNKEYRMSKEGVLSILSILKKSERSDPTLRHSAVLVHRSPLLGDSIFCGSLFPVFSFPRWSMRTRQIFFWLSCLSAVILSIILFGCAPVGPDYVPPTMPSPKAWHTNLKYGLTTNDPAPETLATWWETLHDPTLTKLMEQAVTGNLDLKVARSRVRAARARRTISRSGLFPSVDASASGTRNRLSEERYGGDDYDLYAAGFDATWELDIFGGTRRSVEAADADIQEQEEDLRDVMVSLLSEVALNYIDVRTFQAGIVVAWSNLEAQENTFQLTQSRYEAGLTNELAVQQATYNIENTRSKIPVLRIALEGAMNHIAVLLGQEPGALHAELKKPRMIPFTPPIVAVNGIIRTLRRRPDLRSAERRLAAQTARVGEATADLYPRFRLLGSIGLETLSLGDVFSASGLAYLIGPSISWPVFNAEAIRSNIEVQSELQEQALLEYEAAVLNALKDVENALISYAEEQNRRKALSASAEAAERAVELSESQYQAGLTDFTGVLDAQRSLLSFQEQLTRSEGAVTSNLVRLYKALGGGWVPLPRDASQDSAEP